MENKTLKLFFAFGLSLLFIALGFHLIEKEENIAKIIGYANIIFWSGIWVAVGIKLIFNYLKRTKNNL